MSDAFTERALAKIGDTDDPENLRKIASNAHAKNNAVVENAARRKLYSVLPSESPGTLEYDVWQSIYALEDVLSQERGKTTRLGRTRPKIDRSSEQETVADLIMKPASDGFRMLVERDLTNLTFEAVALRHPQDFASDVLDQARRRLAEVNYKVD